MHFLDTFKKTTVPIHSAKQINPHRHWILLLKIFFSVICVFIVGSFYLLYQIGHEQFVQAIPVPEHKESLLKESLLSSITGTMQQKAARTKDLLYHPISYTDPSR